MNLKNKVKNSLQLHTYTVETNINMHKEKTIFHFLLSRLTAQMNVTK